MQQQLVSDKVSIVLGSYSSGVSIAASDIFKDGGVPALGISCTNPQITQGNTHYFRICFLDPFQGTVLANFAKDNFSAKKAYVLTKLGDDYSAGLGHYFSKAFEELGGECVEETFPDGNSDFASYITSAKNSGADVVFAPTSTEAAALIIEQAASQGLETPILASDTWDSNVILKAAKGKNLQIYVTTFYQEGGNEEFDKGIKNITTKIYSLYLLILVLVFGRKRVGSALKIKSILCYNINVIKSMNQKENGDAVVT